jgi:hypothetical protein
MFTTTSIADTAILLRKGAPLTHIRPGSGGLFAFDLDISEEQARSILTEPDAAVCYSFHRAWRQLRRRMDAIRYGGEVRR